MMPFPLPLLSAGKREQCCRRRCSYYAHPNGEVLATRAREFLVLPPSGVISVHFESADRFDDGVAGTGGVEGDAGRMLEGGTSAQGFLELQKL